MLRLAVVFGILFIATITLAFTSFDDGLPPLPDDPMGRGAFTFAVPNDPGSLDPNTTSASSDFRVVKLLYEPLLVVPWGGGVPEPGTAEALPEVSPDGMTYTFIIREDARWSDDHPVTAEDFVFGWRRVVMPDSGSQYASLMYLIEGARQFRLFRQGLLDFETIQDDEVCSDEERAELLERFPNLQRLSNTLSDQEKLDLSLRTFDQIVAIDALDDRTVQVRLETPTAYFIDLCAFPTFSPMPVHVVEPLMVLEDGGAWRIDSTYFGDPGRLVTNGPYYLSEWNPRIRQIFDQNPHYWNREAMGNIRIVQEVIQDTSLQVLQFEEGLIDWIPDTGAIAQQLSRSDYPDLHLVPSAGTYYYHFNCRPQLPNGVANPMQDVDVRRAMAMCFDRQEIVEFVTRMNEPTAELIVPHDSIEGYEGPSAEQFEEFPLPSYDPQAAAELLAEAGYPGGEGFPPIEILVNNDGGPGHTNIALVIKQAWEEHLGLEVTIEAIEFKVLLDRSEQGNFFTRRAGWFGDYADATTWLDMHRREDSNNHAGYFNQEYEDLLEAAAVELDPVRRAEMLGRAEALLMYEAPIVPIYYYYNQMIYDADRIDLRPNAWNNLRLEMVPVQRDE